MTRALLALVLLAGCDSTSTYFICACRENAPRDCADRVVSGPAAWVDCPAGTSARLVVMPVAAADGGVK